MDSGLSSSWLMALVSISGATNQPARKAPTRPTDDIEHDPLTRACVHRHAGDPTYYRADDQPDNEIHSCSPSIPGMERLFQALSSQA